MLENLDDSHHFIFKSYYDSLVDKLINGKNKSIYHQKLITQLCDNIKRILKDDLGRGKEIFRKEVDYYSDAMDKFFLSQECKTYWLHPLIKQLYENAGIYDGREILIVENNNIHSGRYNVLSGFPSIICNPQDSRISSFPINEKTIYDIFTIPSDSKFDIALTAMIAHEVGHVIIDIFAQDVTDLINKASLSYEDDEVVMSQNIREYLCDEIGRALLGPAFDIALLKDLSTTWGGKYKSNSIHPPIALRIIHSLNSLKNYCKLSEGYKMQDSLKEIYEMFLALPLCQIELSNISEKDKNIERIFTDGCKEFIKQIKKTITIEEINSHWDVVINELDEFRPPFENVSCELPKLISPDILINITTLYYYSKSFKKNNLFYTRSNYETEKEKIDVLSKKLVEHLKYCISLYDFLLEIRKKLSDKEIENESEIKLQKNTVWQLRDRKSKDLNFVVVPTSDPDSQYNSNSVDLRLGNIFITPKLTNHTHLPIIPPYEEDLDLSIFYEKHYMKFDGEFTLHPHSFVLAQTLEYTCIPNDFYAMVLGRSSWGRVGLTIATAVAVGPGFRGCITLELRNLGETPIKLKIGSRICQLVLIATPIKSDYEYVINNAKYVGPVSAEIPELKSDKDWNILKFDKPEDGKINKNDKNKFTNND